jgi:hypothetical protein
MLAIRFFSFAALAAGGFALLNLTGSTQARQPKDDLPKAPPNILVYKDGNADPKKAKEAFAIFAKYNAEYIAHPKVYSNPQEFVPPTRFGQLVLTTDQLISELNRHVFAPLPGSKIGPDQADYIRELGLALDTELKAVIERNPSQIVKINAARMLAAACRSGATAHYPTVTGLITNPNVPPEVKYHAFHAAANLLSAYDLNDYPIRAKHSNKPKAVTELVSAIQNAILKPGNIVPAPAAGAELPPDQVEVLRFIRRQAIRALAQVRFSERAPGVPPSPDLYPAFTLAQIAVSDPAIQPPPTETEVAEAVIGLCNISPLGRDADKAVYASAMADAAATGIITFATRRAANPLDKTIPWRYYGARLSEALHGWPPLFDPAYNPARPIAAIPAPKPVEDLVADADRRVLKPMYEGVGNVDLNGLRQFRDLTLRGDKKWTLSPFTSNPKLTLTKHN